MQVLARLVLFVTETIAQKNVPAIRICAVCLICLILASLILYGGKNSMLLVAVFVALQGGPHGLISIVRPIITAEFMGRVNFGLISSMVAFGAIWGSSIAPAMAGSVSERLGYGPMLLLTGTIALIGLVSLMAVVMVRNSTPRILNT
jgi:MFS family permease